MTGNKIEFNSSGLKMCNRDELKTLGRFVSIRSTWVPVRGLSPSCDETNTLFISELLVWFVKGQSAVTRMATGIC